MNEHIAEWYEKYTEDVYSLMKQLWENPEVGLHEYRSCQLTAEFAEKFGFSVEVHAAEDFDNAAAVPNTVIARWGSGSPVIGIIGELDALPELGQDAVPYRKKIDGAGHGCGHCIMSGGAAAAAAAIKNAMARENLKGTVVLIETPAEEIGVGKTFLAKNGVFKDLDIALMWHPFQINFNFDTFTSRAIYDLELSFTGNTQSCNTDACIESSALDALQLMNTALEFRREHLKKYCDIHYVITDGGVSPEESVNHASEKMLIRAPEPLIGDLLDIVTKAAESAAIMTGTQQKCKIQSGVSGFIMNHALHRRAYEAALKVEPLCYTEEEYRFGRELVKSVTGKNVSSADKDVLITKIDPYSEKTRVMASGGCCTDAAEISYFCPTLHYWGGGRLRGMPSHHWNVTALMGTSIAQKAGIYAYKILAQTAYDALTDPGFIEECWNEFNSLDIPAYKPRF